MRPPGCRLKPSTFSWRNRPMQGATRSRISHQVASYATTFHGRPCRLAVIGSGPAGFYTAYRVMSKLPGVKVDMYEALPVPFGLVRFGVAPDHPEVKNCQDKFTEVAESKNFRFIGNTSIGHPFHPGGAAVPLDILRHNYDGILFAYGASKDKTLGVDGEDLRGIYSAREFVGWYNGLPEHAGLNPDLTAGDTAVVIGQGNVALDVARILLEDVDRLRRTDIAEHALETLSRSKIRRVHVVGRRGPMQAAFTIKEIRELMNLPEVALHPVDTSLIPPDLSRFPRPTKRLMEVLLKGSATTIEEGTGISSWSNTDSKPPILPKSWSLDFCLAPYSFRPESPTHGNTSNFDYGHVGQTLLRHKVLSSTYDLDATAMNAPDRPKPVHIPTAIAFRSIGYKAEALPGMLTLGIPFDSDRGTVEHDGTGRVTWDMRGQNRLSQAAHPRLYCAGWVKRGPTGVIASTMADAFETADAIVEDWIAGDVGRRRMEAKDGWEGVRSAMKGDFGGKVVEWKDWKAIDRAEIRRGKEVDRPRVKFATVDEMLDVVGN